MCDGVSEQAYEVQTGANSPQSVQYNIWKYDQNGKNYEKPLYCN